MRTGEFLVGTPEQSSQRWGRVRGCAEGAILGLLGWKVGWCVEGGRWRRLVGGRPGRMRYEWRVGEM